MPTLVVEHDPNCSIERLADVDPRVEASGGYRRIPTDPKSNYEWPGMTPLPDWQRTHVHRHTRFYECAKCNTRFGSPHAVYTHLAKEHPRKGRPATGFGRMGGDLSPSNGSGGGNSRVEASSLSEGVSARMGVTNG